MGEAPNFSMRMRQVVLLSQRCQPEVTKSFQSRQLFECTWCSHEGKINAKIMVQNTEICANKFFARCSTICFCEISCNSVDLCEDDLNTSG